MSHPARVKLKLVQVKQAEAPSSRTEIFSATFFKDRNVTDLDVTDLGFSGPRIPFCATHALWGRVTSFFDHFLSI